MQNRWLFCFRSGLLVLISTSFLTAADPPAYFRAPRAYPTGADSVSVAAGDFNGDHRPDLAVVNLNSNTVSILLNNTTGVFGPAVNYAIPALAEGIAVGDFNGDGIPDLAVAVDDGVAVLLGNGDGTFQAEKTTGVPCLCYSVAVGDFNRDGKSDLVVAGMGNQGTIGSLTVLLGKGDGTFETAAAVGQGTILSVAVGDFNGDRRADLAYVQQYSDQVTVLLGMGDGTFGTPASYTAIDPASEIIAADLNHDGNIDLVVEGAETSVLLGNGNGTFGMPQQYLTSSEGAAVAAGDFNGDGNLDLAVATSRPGDLLTQRHDVYMLLGDGKGGFTVAGAYSAGNGAGGVVAADFNQDGKLDLAVATPGAEFEGGVIVLEGKGDGSFIEPVAGQAAGNGSVAVGDFNSDGSMDVATTTGAGVVAVFLGNGMGEFQSPLNSAVAQGESPSEGLQCADVNGDGKLDLVVTIENPPIVQVLLGNGDGTFQPAITLSLAITPSALAVGDFNGDGKPDLVVAGSYPSSVIVYIGNGDGTFQAGRSFPTVRFPEGLAVADFNRDGNLDLVVTGGGVSILLGRGDGTFAPGGEGMPGSQAERVAVGDFNGDGFPDVVVGTAIGEVDVFLGDRAGGLKPALPYRFGVATREVAVGDFNNDGILDIAAADTLSNSVFILPGVGDGTFNLQPISFGVSGPPHSIALGDRNGHGRVDLVVGADPGIDVLYNARK